MVINVLFISMTTECDKDHQQWSNHSHCMTTCLDRFTTIPVEDCEELNPGCICEDGYFEDQNGNCVENEDCSVCYHPDSPSLPIQVHTFNIINWYTLLKVTI